MKVAYCSDLHIESGTLELKNTENAEVLILAAIFFIQSGRGSDKLEKFRNQ